jgi:DICT domain-containing protein
MPAVGASGELSTAQLAGRTGLPPATLRAWESRHNFPAPARLPGGHRRYSESDVTAVLEVQRLRRQGLSLAAAIGRVARHDQAGERSVFAGLRRRRPELVPWRLPKPALLQISHAIEDEYLARATSGVVFGCFQRERFYRGSEARWRELARTADLAVAVADFASIRRPPAAATEVPLELQAPLAREWVLVVDAPRAHACLAAWELPSPAGAPDRERQFETIWSFEPGVVRAAGEVCSELLWQLAPDIARRLVDLHRDPGPGAEELQLAGALAQRIVGYLGALVA